MSWRSWESGRRGRSGSYEIAVDGADDILDAVFGGYGSHVSVITASGVNSRPRRFQMKRLEPYYERFKETEPAIFAERLNDLELEELHRD